MKKIYCDYPVRRISPKNEHCFFGYYDLPAYDKSGRYHLYGKIGFMDRMPLPEDVIELGVADLTNDSFEPFAQTTAWNLQQGALMQWHGAKADTVFYNQRKGGEFVTVEQNLKTGQKRYSPAAASISHDGKHGLSINFSRIYDFRPGYGYAGIPDPYEENVPENDGVWLTDIETGDKKLLLSYRELLEASGIQNYEGTKYVINHINFNPSSTAFALLLRDFPVPPKSRHLTTLIFADLDGNMVTAETNGIVSHYHWRDGDTLVAYCEFEGERALFLIDRKTGTHSKIAISLPGDIHCSYSPDRRYIIGDGYPVDGYRYVRLYDMKTNQTDVVLNALSIPIDELPLEDIRCDLHVRWRPDGKAFSFDTIHNGYREIYEADISRLVEAGL